MSMITIPPKAKSLNDFSPEDQGRVMRLDEIFWKEIAGMSCAGIFFEVKTIGGRQKALAIQDITKRLKAPLPGVMYVGDSITDVEAFQLVRGNGGLTVSFNGNHYAIKNAEVAVLSEKNSVTAFLADVFLKQGKEKVVHVVKNWNRKSLRLSGIEPALLERLFEVYPKDLPKVQIVTSTNMETLSKESSEFRKKVRGEAVGKLG